MHLYSLLIGSKICGVRDLFGKCEREAYPTPAALSLWHLVLTFFSHMSTSLSLFPYCLFFTRYYRDHLRYVDDIMCAAARVIEAVRDHARKNKNYDASRDDGIYDAVHIRRGDFQYPPVLLPADELYELSKGELSQGSTLYIATDERVSS